ncbi:MAG: cytidylate kinase-like family protein [Proteiniphilum sp.]|jgi:cytidylate kinase|uniref:cytidylate kinase-like family protein n=1 Tax=Proteiniphilum sp. TaxID=1926877 RepID=UPI002B2192BE|nr:cytidylate kinase-like family protein [Proteiniphilum sp.]MEA5128444.1 cytidylate kinase-like family protein [Proteiniphilum sp.]
MKDNFIINIGRQLGSGGRQIGRLLAKRLDIAFYDKELITLASKQSGLAKEVFEKADEKKRFTLTGGLLGLKTSVLDEDFSNNYLWNEMLFKIQSDVIRDLAHEKSCIFVGRCADYILRDHPRALNVFISAEEGDRIKRVMDYYELTEKKALELIGKTDKKRAGYYNYYSNKQWGAAESYHLCINSSVLGIEATTGFIESFLHEFTTCR